MQRGKTRCQYRSDGLVIEQLTESQTRDEVRHSSNPSAHKLTRGISVCISTHHFRRHFNKSVRFSSGELNVSAAKRRRASRCGHFEQVKVGRNWKCVACGQILTVAESVQNSIELSEVMRSAIESRRPLRESLDDLLGRKEWEDMRAGIPVAKRSLKRRRR